MRAIWIIIFACFFYGVKAQSVSMDSSSILKFDDFYAVVLAYHPIVQQANLLTDQAIQEVRLARGAFDPKLQGSWNQKRFSDTEYYNLLDVSLKIPVWFPVNPEVGFMQNRGAYLNPENFISDATNNQQLYAGVSVPIGQGLFIDQRRATVRQALIFQDMAEAEQIKEINKVLLTAAKDYWEWYYAYNNYILMQQNIAITQDIFNRTKMGFEYGEVAAIDTIQAKITLLNRITDFQQANIDRIKAALSLSNHLWSPEGLPLELKDYIRPEALPVTELGDSVLLDLVTLARANHPELQKLRLKNEALIVERSLARENLKPRIDLKYQFLDQPFTPEGENNGWTFDNNYRVGIDFAFPIFLRKERAKIGQTNLKIRDNNLEQDFVEREIVNEINAQYTAVVNTGAILTQLDQMVTSYQQILAAERINLENGESDLFKINIQLEKLIEAQTKLLKLRADYQKSVATLYWSAGIQNLGY
ncbi:TolC family protein [Fulvivirga sedimenti]|uniref:TolC family protein n=1 Tax=Fulvivirga sedimenti TaxID=2879465 RepID=A0A9X1KWF8_9BACT|nr:TolC family protein [Fulvivirga sedimenti]MCA6074735.1 TolC family protein [Fulvivirga sedimenti]MCA6075912.1 TolC family protein [Fulvivirga sedimenti]MCA6077040.1 TolC family protein [Fulvivirga sedimenti]